MKLPPRVKLSPAKNNASRSKRFKRIVEVPSHLEGKISHPFFVICDLQRGSLAYLDLYLKQNKGIPDRAVALELRKLISGSSQRTPYRLEVTQHPDAPKNPGGRPKRGNIIATDQERSIATRVEHYLKLEGKKYIAKELAAKEFKISLSTVTRALQNVAKDHTRQRASEEAVKGITEYRQTVLAYKAERLARLEAQLSADQEDEEG